MSSQPGWDGAQELRACLSVQEDLLSEPRSKRINNTCLTQRSIPRHVSEGFGIVFKPGRGALLSVSSVAVNTSILRKKGFVWLTVPCYSPSQQESPEPGA